MILPITAYGDPVLKKVTQDITPEYPNLKTLIDNMWETMYSAEGVGLAAPQVGLDIRMAVIDASPFATDDELPKAEREFLKTFKKVFINPHISERWGEPWGMEEGCLSLPGIHEKVFRPDAIRITYMDENWLCCSRYPARIRPSGRQSLYRPPITSYSSYDTETSIIYKRRTCKNTLSYAFPS